MAEQSEVSSTHLSLVNEASEAEQAARRDAEVREILLHANIKVAPLGLAALETIGEPASWSADLTVLPIFCDERPLQGLAGVLDWRLGGRLSAMVRQGICTGAPGEHVLTLSRTTAVLWRVVLLGLGMRHGFDHRRAAEAGEQVRTLCQNLCVQDLLLGLPFTEREGEDQPALVWASGVVGACSQGAGAHRLWLLAQRECVAMVEQNLATTMAN